MVREHLAAGFSYFLLYTSTNACRDLQFLI
nr:MAG TPA: hypothetical protein [Caudoviricetes sp.]